MAGDLEHIEKNKEENTNSRELNCLDFRGLVFNPFMTYILFYKMSLQRIYDSVHSSFPIKLLLFKVLKLREEEGGIGEGTAEGVSLNQ